MAENDPLERFVRDNRDEFDREAPSSNVWEQLSEQLQKEELVGPSNEVSTQETKVISLQNWWKYTAAAVVVFSITWLAWPSKQKEPVQMATQQTNTNNVDGYSLADVSGEMAEVEEYYVTSVNDRMKQLRELNVDPELLKEIEFLDTEYQALQEEMGGAVNSNQIVEAMIDNYRLRLDLLESMLEAFGKDENKKQDQSNETDSALNFY